MQLTDGRESYAYPSFALKGTILAYGADTFDGADFRTEVIVRDFRRSPSPVLVVGSDLHVAEILIRDARRVAWATCATGEPANEHGGRRCRPDGPSAVALYKHDATTPGDASTLLDEDLSIPLHSFTLDGSTVRWRSYSGDHTNQLE